MPYVREARMEDRASCIAIAKMYHDTRTFAAPWFSGQENFLESENCWVLEEADDVAGFYFARFLKRDFYVNLDYIAVALPGHGMGQLLLDHLKLRVRRSGSHAVIKTKVGQRSRNFWIRNSFELDDNRGTWST